MTLWDAVPLCPHESQRMRNSPLCVDCYNALHANDPVYVRPPLKTPCGYCQDCECEAGSGLCWSCTLMGRVEVIPFSEDVHDADYASDKMYQADQMSLGEAG